MKTNIRTAIASGIAVCWLAAQLSSHAQTTSAANTTTVPQAAATTTPDSEAIIKELTDMKARIEQLESELKAVRDANALRAAEKTAVSGAPSSPAATGQAAAAPPPAAAPAPPEMRAEVTTKEAPFPGDWTWLNSNGRVVDTPMATKYFTPEFRADVNYTLDYNHPEDDSLGGSTETFRSDEVQIEQLSFGGDIRIDNVRGRFLTMYGMFATTTPRNDGSPNRGQWDRPVQLLQRR